MDYSVCCQKVTVYRKTPQGIVRFEIPDCFLQWHEEITQEQLGRQQERRFLLVQPGESQLVFPGDRVYEGVGPIEVDWDTFIPVLVEKLGEVAYTTAYHWQGEFCHTEAGRKWVHR